MLAGFTIYYSGDSSGGAERRHQGIVRTTRAAQHAAPKDVRDAAAMCAAMRISPQAASAQAVGAATCASTPAAAQMAPPTAAMRRRGCRGGKKHKKRMQTRHEPPPAPGAAVGVCARACAPASASSVNTGNANSSPLQHPAPRGPSMTGSTSTVLSASATAFLPRGGKRVRDGDDRPRSDRVP